MEARMLLFDTDSGEGAVEPVLGKHVGCIHWEGHGKDGLGDALTLSASTVYIALETLLTSVCVACVCV